MKTKYLDKMLKDHKPFCEIWEFSLKENRYCSCGLGKAREELEVLKDAMKLLEKLDLWLDKEDSLASNSVAHQEIDELMERAEKYG